MQFLVYLTVLMVSVSTILLEVHWLTSPPPQSKPAVQAASPPVQAPNTENSNASLSPVYPAKPDTLGPINSASNAQQSNTNAQQSDTAANNTSAGAAPKTTTQTAQQPAAQAPAQQTPAQTTANAALPQSSSGETTGAAVRGDDSKQAAPAPVTGATNTPNRVTNPQDLATRPDAAATNNRCDVQACSSAYNSFRASDCTYQPFEGARRFCEKPPVQPTARDQRQGQRQEPESRRWSRDTEPRDVDRSVKWRTDDRASDRDLDLDDDSDRIVIRRSGPRW